jgi:hypothetical protein
MRQLRRALFVCDREELRNQALAVVFDATLCRVLTQTPIKVQLF